MKVKSNDVDMIKLNKKIFKENVEFLERLNHVKPLVDFNKMEEHYKNHLKLLMFMTNFPESYKKKELYDPLIVTTGLPKNILIKKSKCYLDVNNLTENRSLGRMTIEVYDSIVPKTAGNFKMLCEQRPGELDYSGTQIFRIVPGLFCLAGDVEYSIGLGGVSAINGEQYFDDENYALSHNAAGLIAYRDGIRKYTYILNRLYRNTDKIRDIGGSGYQKKPIAIRSDFYGTFALNTTDDGLTHDLVRLQRFLGIAAVCLATTCTLSMYNLEKNENASQFMITFKPLTVLNGRHVVFGRVVGGMKTLRLIEDSGYASGKPKHKIVISKCGIFNDC